MAGTGYRPEYEKDKKFKDWLRQDLQNRKNAYCRWCKSSLKCKRTNLIMHTNSMTHQKKLKQRLKLMQKMKNPSEQKCGTPVEKTSAASSSIASSSADQSTPEFSIVGKPAEPVKLQTLELRLLLCTLLHNDFDRSDHFIQILQSPTDDPLIKMNLHNIKCIKILTELSKRIREELREDIGDQHYSLLIEEYSFHNGSKYWCLCIRYSSARTFHIRDRFLGLVKVEDAHNPAEPITRYLANFGLDLKNLIGFGADADNLKCINTHGSSVWKVLVRCNPNVQLTRYLPHSLEICLTKVAVEHLPANVCKLWRTVYNHFTKESDQATYLRFFGGMNEDIVKTLKRSSPGREPWLAGVDIINAMLDHWQQLGDYFSKAAELDDSDGSKKRIGNIFIDSATHLYFIITSHVLNEIKRVDLLLKKPNVDIVHIYTTLYQLVYTLMNGIIQDEALSKLEKMTASNFEEIQKILKDPKLIAGNLLYFGKKFKDTKEKILKTRPDMPDMINDVVLECQNFILHVCQEIARRFPLDLQVFQALRTVSVQIRREHEKPNFQNLPLKLMNKDIESILESEWNRYVTMPLPADKLESSSDLWMYVKEYKNVANERDFSELPNCVLRTLSLPSSNSAIATAFSLSKSLTELTRDEIAVDVLNAIIHIRHYFSVMKLDCHSFNLACSVMEQLEDPKLCDKLCDHDDVIVKLIRSSA